MKPQNDIAIVIPFNIMSFLFAQEKPACLVALYHFYYYKKAIYPPYSPTVSETAKELHISEDRVRKAKKRLIDLNLVEETRKNRIYQLRVCIQKDTKIKYI